MLVRWLAVFLWVLAIGILAADGEQAFNLQLLHLSTVRFIMWNENYYAITRKKLPSQLTPAKLVSTAIVSMPSILNLPPSSEHHHLVA